jgi:hypothetical protein
MKSIVFVREALTPRTYNMVRVLKDTGKYRLVLICGNFDNYTLGLFEDVFDEIICYQPEVLDFRKLFPVQIFKSSPSSYLLQYLYTRTVNSGIGGYSKRTRLRSILEKIDGDLFVCPCGADETAFWLMAWLKKPVVLDCYNGSISKGIENLSDKQRVIDQFNFEHASGVIYRGSPFELDYYRVHGYNIVCLTLPFLDYCNPDFFVKHPVSKLSNGDGEYHLVGMGGGMSSMRTVYLAKQLAKQHIHYHVYCVSHSITSPLIFKELVKLDKSEKYFHIEDTLPFDIIPFEICRYDFGSMIIPQMGFDELSLDYHLANHGYRIFTFLEAGLPIIISSHLDYQKNTVEDFNVGFSIGESDFDILKRLLDHAYLYSFKFEENLKTAREQLSIDNHRKELVDFFDRVIGC